MLTVLEVVAVLYFGTGFWFGIALLGEWIADRLDERQRAGARV